MPTCSHAWMSEAPFCTCTGFPSMITSIVSVKRGSSSCLKSTPFIDGSVFGSTAKPASSSCTAGGSGALGCAGWTALEARASDERTPRAPLRSSAAAPRPTSAALALTAECNMAALREKPKR